MYWEKQLVLDTNVLGETTCFRYKCIGRNNLGTAEDSITLNIQGKGLSISTNAHFIKPYRNPEHL